MRSRVLAPLVVLACLSCAPASGASPPSPRPAARADAAPAPHERPRLEAEAFRGRTEVAADPAAYDSLSMLELAILAELNAARTNPAAYARRLEGMLPYFDDRNVLRMPGTGVAVVTREGARAVREAIAALRAAPRTPALAPRIGLQAAARDHVRDQGRTGGTGHIGADGGDVARRVSRHGAWVVSLGENIAYGPPTAREVVASLLIDDNVPDRGHRTVLLDPTSRVVGISCGTHPRFEVMCVMVHAGGFSERAAADANRAGAAVEARRPREAFP